MHTMQPNINLYVFFYKRLCMHPVHVQPYRNLFYESMQLCNMHPYAFNKGYYCSYGLILDLCTKGSQTLCSLPQGFNLIYSTKDSTSS